MMKHLTGKLIAEKDERGWLGIVRLYLDGGMREFISNTFRNNPYDASMDALRELQKEDIKVPIHMISQV
jgi:hypothetical protein